MKWLPDAWSRRNPCCSRKRMTSRGLTAGSRGIFKIQGGDESFVVARDWLFVLLQAFYVSGDSVLRHFSSFVQGAAIGDTSWKRRNKRRKAALGLWPKNNVVAVVSLCHLIPDSIRLTLRSQKDDRRTPTPS